MKIKLNTYKILFRLLEFLSNSKLLHKTVINQKIYLGASIISLSMINSGCTSDNTETKSSNDKKDSNIDNLKDNEITKSKQDGISGKIVKSKSTGREIHVFVTCYDTEIKNITETKPIDSTKEMQLKNGFPEDVMCYVVEIVPSFKGGDLALHQYLDSNIIRPKGTEDIDGTVYIGFKINKNGNIKDVVIKRSLHPLLDSEAIRVVKNIPDWVWPDNYTPKSDIDYILPIKFKKLNED